MLIESLNWITLLGLLEYEVGYYWDFILGLGMEEKSTEGFGGGSLF